jgi:subtilisin family serine protease
MDRSLTTVKADLARAEFGLTGEGLVCAVVSTGVDGRNPHFAMFGNTELPKPLRHLDYSFLHADRMAERRDAYRKGNFDEPEEEDLLLRDRYAIDVPVDGGRTGTAVASIIAGRSRVSDDRLLQGFTDRTKILSIRVFDDKGAANELDFRAALRAIQVLNQNADRLLIHCVVLPLHFPWDVRNYACGRSPICAEVDRLVNAGVVVVASAGNRSYDEEHDRVVEGGITDPGNAELAIVVGSTHRHAPDIYGASFFSCRGPTADGRNKPDLLAPGERVAVAAPAPPDPPPSQRRTGRRPRRAGRTLEEAPPAHAIDLDGTEIAAAHVAGAALAVLSVQPALIGKPQEVKELLLRSALDLHRDRTYQGYGLLDVLAAVRAAAGSTKQAQSPSGPRKVFISYSHKDEPLWKEFKAHLAPMERTGRIQIWSDQKLEAGQRWEKEIYARLNDADIVLLLVSAHFFESEFCYSKELERALEREAGGSARVIPVIVRPVSLKGTPLAEIQSVPSGARPITSFGDPHEGWTQVADHLFDIIEKLAGRKP